MSAFDERGDASGVTVYTKPGCVQCRATLRAFERAGVTFASVDITIDVQARDFVMSLGYLQAPVVVSGTTHWGGFRPDRIAALADGAA